MFPEDKLKSMIKLSSELSPFEDAFNEVDPTGGLFEYVKDNIDIPHLKKALHKVASDNKKQFKATEVVINNMLKEL